MHKIRQFWEKCRKASFLGLNQSQLLSIKICEESVLQTRIGLRHQTGKGQYLLTLPELFIRMKMLIANFLGWFDNYIVL